MKRLVAAAVLVSLGAGITKAGKLPGLEDYAGSDSCQSCHATLHKQWQSTLHSTVIQDAKANPGAILGDFTQPGLGFGKEDIAFTIGGHWSQRYLKVVGDRYYALPKVWSVSSHRWEDKDARTWQKKSYDVYCIGCHVTGYDPETGAFGEHAVGCEACHGPGRRHVQSNGQGAILNPAHLTRDEQDLICASCHVRGTDPTERLHFAVGYTPGAPLEDFYVPIRMEDGEDRRSALLRGFRDWRGRMERGEPPGCEVCGIERPARPQPSPEERCQGCHRYGEMYPSHTNHPRSAGLGCLDCHQRTVAAEKASSDVHAPEYFRVHRQVAYTTPVADSCRNCHSDYTRGALDDALRKWDHSRHDRAQ